MEKSVETPGKYQHKSKLESRQMVLGWVFCVYGTQGCWLACSGSAEGLSFKGRNFSAVSVKPCCLSQEAYFTFLFAFGGIVVKKINLC